LLVTVSCRALMSRAAPLASFAQDGHQPPAQHLQQPALTPLQDGVHRVGRGDVPGRRQRLGRLGRLVRSLVGIDAEGAGEVPGVPG
jgi:hypothetical protein